MSSKVLLIYLLGIFYGFSYLYPAKDIKDSLALLSKNLGGLKDRLNYIVNYN